MFAAGARAPDGLESINRMWKATAALAVSLATTQVAFAQDKAQVERGMKAYTEQKCSVCHSIARKGNAKGVLGRLTLILHSAYVPASVTVLACATVFLERRFVRGADAERSGSYSVMS